MWQRANCALEGISFILVVLYFGAAVSIQQGGPCEPKDFPFAVYVQKKTGSEHKTVCVGVIENEQTIITASKCINRTEVSDMIPSPGQPNRLKDWFAVPFAKSDEVLEIDSVLPGKKDDAPELGISELPQYATAVCNLKDPFTITAQDERGAAEGNAPSYTPWPETPTDLEKMKNDGVEGVIFGADKKAAAVKLLKEKDCLDRLAKIPDMKDVLFGWSQMNITDIFCAMKATKAGKFPPGYPCNTDAGAPLVIDNAVWGILMGAWCNSDDDHIAVFRSDARSWNIRRFSGSLTDIPDVRELVEEPLDDSSLRESFFLEPPSANLGMPGVSIGGGNGTGSGGSPGMESGTGMGGGGGGSSGMEQAGLDKEGIGSDMGGGGSPGMGGGSPGMGGGSPGMGGGSHGTEGTDNGKNSAQNHFEKTYTTILIAIFALSPKILAS